MSFYATINNFIAENAIIFSVFIPIISGSIGAYVSYRITIKSEKRKEYNETVEPIFLHLNKTLSFVENKNYNGISVPNDEMMFKLKLRLTDDQFETFEQAINRIILAREELWKNSNEYGSYDHKKITNNMHNEIVNSIKNAISLMKIK